MDRKFTLSDPTTVGGRVGYDLIDWEAPPDEYFEREARVFQQILDDPIEGPKLRALIKEVYGYHVDPVSPKRRLTVVK